ncbi:MAG: metal ABC transporter permease [bacterium]
MPLFGDAGTIMLTAGLVASACAILGVMLVLRGLSLMGDAVSHSILPGIIAVFLIAQTRAPIWVILGAALFAVICVIAIEWLVATRLVRSDAAIGLVFPALFALGVLGVHQFTADLHIDLDSTIYGEIAFVPFRVMEIAGVDVARGLVVAAIVAVVDIAAVALLWKELKMTSFDPGFARASGFAPAWVSRMMLVLVSITAVVAFESVGAILVIALLIIPAATARLLTTRLLAMVLIAVSVGWAAAIAGYGAAVAADASIAGMMGLMALGAFFVALGVTALRRWTTESARFREAQGRSK